MQNQLHRAGFAARQPARDPRDDEAHAALVKIAKLHRPDRPQSTPSAFANWIFDLTTAPRLPLNREQAKSIGRAVESDILVERKRLVEHLDRPSEPRDWRLVFEDPLDGSAQPKVASRLTVQGRPMRCIPDYALQHGPTGDILVVERKVTRVPEEKVPLGGWPNLKVQLWCYGWIDDWRRAPYVFLAGQIYGLRPSEGPFVMEDVRPIWQRADAVFHRQCLELFEIYGGRFSG